MLSLLKNIGSINVTYAPSGIITFYNILSNLITLIETSSYACKKNNLKTTS